MWIVRSLSGGLTIAGAGIAPQSMYVTDPGAIEEKISQGI
jgi:hypothetical protein